MSEASPQDFAKNVVTPLVSSLDSAGLTLERLITKLNEELEATFQRCFFDRGGKEGGAKVVYSEPLVDWKTRQTARIDAHKLRGDYPAEKFDITGGNITVVSNIEREPKPEEFKDAEFPHGLPVSEGERK